MQHRVKGMFIAIAILTAFQLFQYRIQYLVFLTPFHRVVTFGFERLHLFHSMAKNKDILFAHLLSDFNVSAVQRSHRQRPVQRQLHVAGAGRLFPGSRDLLGNIRRWNEHFRRRDAIIRQENDLQLIAHRRVIINGFRDLIDSKMMFFAR